MANKVGELYWKVTANTSDFDKGLKNTDTEAKGMSKTFSKLGTFLKTGFAVAAIAGITSVSKKVITLAADANESVNAVQVVFGEAADGILEFSENAVENLGLSSTAFNELSTVIGAQLKLAGGDIDLLDDKVIELSTRAADTASVFNVDVNEALTAFGSALRGEAEPARRFGVNISEAAVQAEALASGLVKNKNEITDQIKIQARYNIIMKQTNDLAGDFSNTSGSFSNQLKIAKSGFSDLGAEIGRSFLPAAAEALGVANDFISTLKEMAKASNDLSDAQKAYADGTSTAAQTMLVLNERLERLKKTRADTAQLTQVNTAALDEQIKTLELAIDAAERRDEANKRANSARQRGETEAAEIAEAEAARAEVERLQAEQRAADIEFRNEIWGRTEESRIAAIEAEIAELELFKESDIKAQEALAYLREELANLKADTEELMIVEETRGRNFRGEIAAEIAFVEDLGSAIANVEESTEDWEEAQRNAIENGLAGFDQLIPTIVTGENAFASMAATAVGGIADVIRALAAEAAAIAAVAGVAALSGDLTQIPAALKGGVEAAALFTVAGGLDAAASAIATPSPPSSSAPTASTAATTPAATSRGSGSGGNVTINNLISLGKEADIRRSAELLYPYLDEVRIRRGE